MKNLYLRRAAYLKEMIPIIKGIQDWDKVFRLFIRPGDSQVLHLRSGEAFRVNHYLDALTIKEVFLGNEYPLDVKTPDVIIDIGANIGTFSVYAAKKFPNAKIYAFEPGRKTYSALVENLQINGIKNVTPIQSAVADKRGKLKFFESSASGLSSLYASRKGSAEYEVPTLSLDDVFTENAITHCDLMKMDCEGAEYDIFFNTSKKTMDKISSISLEYHEDITKYGRTDLVKYLNEMGFKTKVRPHDLEENIGVIYASKA